MEGPSNQFHTRPGIESGNLVNAEIFIILEKLKGKKGLGQTDSLELSIDITKLLLKLFTEEACLLPI